MRFSSIWKAIWGCEPTIAAYNVEEVAWTGSPRMVAKEVGTPDPLRKEIIIATSTQVIARVVCLVNSTRKTTIEFSVPARTSRTRDAIVRDLLERIERRAREQRLVANEIGFRPNGGAK